MTVLIEKGKVQAWVKRAQWRQSSPGRLPGGHSRCLLWDQRKVHRWRRFRVSTGWKPWRRCLHVLFCSHLSNSPQAKFNTYEFCFCWCQLLLLISFHLETSLHKLFHAQTFSFFYKESICSQHSLGNINQHQVWETCLTSYINRLHIRRDAPHKGWRSA